MYIAIFLILISSKKSKNDDCQSPPGDYTDISEGFSKKFSNEVVYGCKGSYNACLTLQNSRLLLYSCIFKKIQSDCNGGAICFVLSDQIKIDATLIKNCTFEDCSTYLNGGSIYFYASKSYTSIQITNTNFIHNKAIKYGGAVYIQNNHLMLEECQFNNNIGRNGNDFYCNILKYGSLDFQEGLFITNCFFEFTLYKYTPSSIRIFGESFDFTFKNNTILIKKTNSDPQNFAFLYLEEKSGINSFTFTENFISPFNKEWIENDVMKRKNLNFAESFTESPLSYKNCPLPPDDCQDISDEFVEIEENKKIYGCHGNYNDRVDVKNSLLLIYSCKFTLVRSTENGGAIMIAINNNVNENNKGDHIIEDCTFEYCNSENFGGSIYININDNTENVIIKNTVFTNNTSTMNGGAVYLYGHRITFDNCQFINNIARTKYGCDFYFEHNDLNDMDTIMIKNSFFDRLLSPDIVSVVHLSTKNILSFYFTGNRIDMRDLETRNKDISFLYLEDERISFADNKYELFGNIIYPFDKSIAANEIMENKDEYDFSTCFSESINHYEVCGNPPEYYQDISYVLKMQFNRMNIYGCHGDINKRVVATNLCLMVYYCKFETTTTSSNGGAIYISIDSQIQEVNKGDYIIERCTFNKCTGNMGGSIYMRQTKSYASIHVTNTIFKQCKSNSNGGAIYYFYDDDYNKFDEKIKVQNVLENCSFVECTSVLGGAIHFSINECFVPFCLKNITFSENRASDKGGALYFCGCNLTIEKCHFTNNYATENGNDIYYYYMNYDIQSQENDYIIKNTKIVKNEFIQSLEDNSKHMLYFLSDANSFFYFLENKIKIIESNLQSQDFSALYFDVTFTNYKVTDNFISPYNEEIAAKFSDRVGEFFYNFTEWFPNFTLIQTQSQNFSKSDDFTKSYIFSKTIDFSISSDFTKSFIFSDSNDFIRSSNFSPSHYFSQSTKFSQSSDFANSRTVPNDSNDKNSVAVNIVGNNNNKNDNKLESWVIILIVIAALFFVIIFVIIVIIAVKKRNEKQSDSNIDTIDNMRYNEAISEFDNPLYSSSANQIDPFDDFNEENKDHRSTNIKIIKEVENNKEFLEFENPLHSSSQDQEDPFDYSDDNNKKIIHTNIQTIKDIENNEEFEEFDNPLYSSTQDKGDPFDNSDEEKNEHKKVNSKISKEVESNKEFVEFDNPLHSSSNSHEDLFDDFDEEDEIS